MDRCSQASRVRDGVDIWKMQSLIPYQEIGQRISEVTTDKNQLIYLYCRSGNRFAIATQASTDLRFANVKNRGAYQDLREQGL